MPYQPFLIGNQRTGLQLNLEPWLLPNDAYASLKNAYLYQGVLKKRQGSILFGQIAHKALNEVIGTGNGSNKDFSGTLAHYPVRVKDISITDGTETFTDTDGDGNLTGSAGGTGTINYTTGAYSVHFQSAPGPGVQVLATYHWLPDLPAMGLGRYDLSTGGQQLLAFNTKRMNYYSDTPQWFMDIGSTDIFTGDDTNYFQMCNWMGKGYITNGKDRVKSWDGTYLTNLLMDISGDAVNDVDFVHLLVPYKSRLIALRTQENSVLKPQRARWCKVGIPGDWTNDEYVDAPTSEWIMGAGFIGNDLAVIFENSVWFLRYTGDRLPFIWQKITSHEGSISPWSVLEFMNLLFYLGVDVVRACDGRDSIDVASRLGNVTLNMNQSNSFRSHAYLNQQKRQIWFNYPSLNATYPDEILVLNYDDKAWSKYALPLMCFGEYTKSADLTWADMEEWEDAEWLWADPAFQAGFPIILGGDQHGYVFQLDYLGTDNGAAIASEIVGGRWNPFVKEGLRARLGWIDLLVDRDPSITLTLDFYLDHNSTPYQSVDIALDDGKGEEKAWLRVYSGAEGQFHRLRLSDNATSQTYSIHAIVPYFKAAGRRMPQ